jgi:hypothetical protein
MSKILKCKIDLTKIDKSKLFKSEKTGAIYADVTILMKDEADQYGNHGMIVQDIGKEAREAGQQGAILGNAKWLETKNDAPKAFVPDEDDDQALPF